VGLYLPRRPRRRRRA